jgi:hypothetical protein
MENTAHNRETWLNQITALYIRPHFQKAGYEIPANVRMSCSLTSKKSAIGQCWDTSVSQDSTYEIFISPTIADSVRVVDILIHELAHAVVGIKNGHNKVFGKCARAVGLEGKLTATVASPELKGTITQWVQTMGEYPHAVLSGEGTGGKKQSTRLLKAECPHCGYTVRLSRKWLELATPECPNPVCVGYQEPMVSDSDTDTDE